MTDYRERIRPYLDQVTKPQQYLGEELNQVRKNWQSAKCRFLFAFPDIYDVGMSHLGMHILYEAVNSKPNLLMERTFSPWIDMAALMQREATPLFSLESGRAAAEFDCIGFTLSHELSYTNVLQMLKLSGLPLRAGERRQKMPLVIAGGPCTANGEPLAPFLDAMVLGDGEEILPALLTLIGEHKQSRNGLVDKPALLADLSVLPGVYVPSLYPAEKADAQAVRGRKAIKKARIASLEDAAFPLKPIVPYVEIVHDRMVLEIMRGCTRGCRFCQAGMIYRPARERSRQTLLAQARALRDNTGHREISLTSLSSSDHSSIHAIVAELCAEFTGERISISLPSLRANSSSVRLAEDIQKVRKTGFTFAPEAGSQKMRDAINKGVTEEELLETVAKAAAAGWRQIKLYFMIGLPGETMEDVDAIAELCEKAVTTGRQAMVGPDRKGWFCVTCAVSNFVPKAQTPFQWIGQAGQDVLRAKQARLKQKIKDKRITLNYHDPFASMLEAIFARGGRDLAPILEAALEKGCRFDSWTEELRPDSWREAFAEAGMDMQALASAAFSLDSPLPWDNFDFGIDKAFLWQEYQKALALQRTADCRDGGCTACGVCFVGDDSNGCDEHREAALE